MEILLKTRDARLIPGEELGKGRKIMREFGLILERRDELIEAISRVEERINIYQRKLETYEKRKEFSKVNRSFELHRSLFYRNLSGEQAQPVHVEEKEVKDFWDTMWNSTERLF